MNRIIAATLVGAVLLLPGIAQARRINQTTDDPVVAYASLDTIHHPSLRASVVITGVREDSTVRLHWSADACIKDGKRVAPFNHLKKLEGGSNGTGGSSIKLTWKPRRPDKCTQVMLTATNRSPAPAGEDAGQVVLTVKGRL